MIKALVSTRPITRELARHMQPASIAARIEHKRERAIAGANKALEALGGWDRPTGLDYVEAIAEAQTTQALLGSEAYRTQAAKLVLDLTGANEKQQAPDAAAALDGLAALAALVRARRAETIEAEVTETET